MTLSDELISQFVKSTKDDTKKEVNTTVHGKTVNYNGEIYVKLDGSDRLTPINTTTILAENERVVVEIKNHTATVTGNMTAPSARNIDLEGLGEDVTVFKEVATNRLVANEAKIGELEADNVTINGKLSANEAQIKDLEVEKLSANEAEITYATIINLNATNANIHNLQGDYGEFKNLATNKFAANDAIINDLEVKKLDAASASITYANIDFANIGKAAIEYIFSKTGLIQDIVVGDGTITGNLVGVTIKGDLIEGNTVVADKLVVKGEDGLYYKLNTGGVKVEAQQTDYNSLNGSIITAKSITATKISVSDLVAFDATIGGFKITDSAIYSGVKESVDNTTRGIYLDKDGQIAFGDERNYAKFYKMPDGSHRLEISADNIIMSSRNKTLDSVINDTDDAISRLIAAESDIIQLADSISTLVRSSDGGSLMTQTADGWTFNIGSIIDTLGTTTNNLNDVNNNLEDVNSVVDGLSKSVNDLGILANYVRIITSGDQPCIELGENDSNFKLRITNTKIEFSNGSYIPAYMSNESLYIKKAVIEDELQVGSFVWKERANGNVGIMWMGGS